MIYRVESHNTSLITRVELNLNEWSCRLDSFISLTEFIDDFELIKQFSSEFNLNINQVNQLKECLSNYQIKYFRFTHFNNQGFTIEPVYLDIRNSKGCLIHWKDWDFVFEQKNGEYYLWCFLGGIADLQREIRLASEQVDKYKEIGLSYIDSLVGNLKRLNNSIEYERAINEGRKVM